MRRHGHLTPVARSSIDHLARQYRHGRICMGIFLRHIYICGAYRFFIHFVANHAVEPGNKCFSFFYFLRRSQRGRRWWRLLCGFNRGCRFCRCGLFGGLAVTVINCQQLQRHKGTGGKGDFFNHNRIINKQSIVNYIVDRSYRATRVYTSPARVFISYSRPSCAFNCSVPVPCINGAGVSSMA